MVRLEWKKNVKPIKSKKVTLQVNTKLDMKIAVGIGILNLQKTFPDINDISLSSCLDYKTKSRVNKGKYPISDKLDLHGYNLEDAYYKLIDFIIKNYQLGSRCLLIITGYGSAVDKTDSIKNSLNKWLSNTKIQHVILYYQQATKKHGGKGAFYVFLRRNRSFRTDSCLAYLR